MATLSAETLGFFDPSTGSVYSFTAQLRYYVDSHPDKEDDTLESLHLCFRGKAGQWYRDLPQIGKDYLEDCNTNEWTAVLIHNFRTNDLQPSPGIYPLDPTPLDYTTQIGRLEAELASSKDEYSTQSWCLKSMKRAQKELNEARELEQRQWQAILITPPPATLEDHYTKPTCKHCKEKFASKNKLHEHLREHSAINSKDAPKSVTPPPATPAPATPAPATPAPATPPPQYRALSPAPPVYETRKAYLTIEDLYIRYAPLNSIVRTEKTRASTADSRSSSPANHVSPAQRQEPRKQVLLTMEDLFKLFEKQGSATAKLQSNSPATLPPHQRKRANHMPERKEYQTAITSVIDSKSSVYRLPDLFRLFGNISISSKFTQAVNTQPQGITTTPKPAPHGGTRQGVLRSRVGPTGSPGRR